VEAVDALDPIAWFVGGNAMGTAIPLRTDYSVTGSDARFLTGAGIGGEYTAINSAIQELVPARYRGRIDLIVNGSFWIGAAIGAAASLVLLDPSVVDPEIGWRAAFLIGAALALVVFFMRLWIPESPRWLMTHHRAAEAEAIVHGIEDNLRRGGHMISLADLPRVRLRARRFTPLAEAIGTMFGAYRRRAVVGLTLMAAQAFFYNAIFFTYALILIDFFGIPADGVGWYLLPFAAENFLGSALLGPFFVIEISARLQAGVCAGAELANTRVYKVFLLRRSQRCGTLGLLPHKPLQLLVQSAVSEYVLFSRHLIGGISVDQLPSLLVEGADLSGDPCEFSRRAPVV
jgi:MFS family permease